jgi:hypothetical protein
VAAACLVFVTRVSREMADFEVYRVAGARVIAGETLFQAGDGHWQFKYLPAFAFVVTPLALVPPAAARAVWFGLSVLLLALLLNRSLVLLPDRRRGTAWLVGLTIAALAKFYLHEINLGQSNLLLATLVVTAVWAWRDHREGTAGALLAAAAMVKPYAVIFLPYLASRRRWKGVAAFTLALAAGLTLPAVRYGWSGNVDLLRDWWPVVTTSTAPNLLGQDNVSIAGMYAAWLGIGPAATMFASVTSLVLLTACGCTILRRTTSPLPEYQDAGLLLFVIPLLSPQGWDYVLLLGTPAVMLLIDRTGDFVPRERWVLVACLATIGLTIFDLLGREWYGAVMMSRVLTVCALVEVWFLMRLRTRGAA